MVRAWFLSSVLSTAAYAGDADVIRMIEEGAASGDLDAAVASALSVYDTNGDGMIDPGKELKAISCPVWRSIDAQVKAEWNGTGARVIMGFSKGFIWVGYAWNIEEKARKSADKAMASCGL